MTRKAEGSRGRAESLACDTGAVPAPGIASVMGANSMPERVESPNDQCPAGSAQRRSLDIGHLLVIGASPLTFRYAFRFRAGRVDRAAPARVEPAGARL